MKFIPLCCITSLLITTQIVAKGIVEEQDAQVSPNEKRLLNKPDDTLKLKVSGLQDYYKVNASIRFKVKANDHFYLYVYYLDYDDNKAVLLLPNLEQKINRYQANQTFWVPKKGFEFYADRVGSEKLVIIATAKPVDLNNTVDKSQNKYLINKASVVDEHVKRLEKKIHFRHSQHKQINQVVKKFRLRIYE